MSANHDVMEILSHVPRLHIKQVTTYSDTLRFDAEEVYRMLRGKMIGQIAQEFAHEVAKKGTWKSYEDPIGFIRTLDCYALTFDDLRNIAEQSFKAGQNEGIKRGMKIEVKP